MRIVKRSYFLSADDDGDNADLLYHGSGNGDITPNSETSHTGDTILNEDPKRLTTTKYPGLQPLHRDTQHVQSGSFSLLQPSISISLKSADISAEGKLDNLVDYDALTSASSSPTSATMPQTSVNVDSVTSSPIPTQVKTSTPSTEQPLNTPPSAIAINISTQENTGSSATTMAAVELTPTLLIKTEQTSTANVPRTDQGTRTIHERTTPQSKSTTIAANYQPKIVSSEHTTLQPTIDETSTHTSGEMTVSSAGQPGGNTDSTSTIGAAAAAEYLVEDQTSANGPDTGTNTTPTVITTTAYPR